MLHVMFNLHVEFGLVIVVAILLLIDSINT